MGTTGLDIQSIKATIEGFIIQILRSSETELDNTIHRIFEVQDPITADHLLNELFRCFDCMVREAKSYVMLLSDESGDDSDYLEETALIPDELFKQELDITLSVSVTCTSIKEAMNGLYRYNYKLKNQEAKEKRYRPLEGLRQPTVPTAIESAPQNLFNNLPLADVHNYFHQLATKLNSAGEPYLTQKEVDLFISRAFLKKSPGAKLRFNLGQGARTKITRLFYGFYKYSVDQCAESPRFNKKKYVTLLTNHFEDFNEAAVSNNFNKGQALDSYWQNHIKTLL